MAAVYQAPRLRFDGDTLPPWRAPHHTTSSAGIFGRSYPGEVRLAASGTLVLPEAHLFHPSILRPLPKALRAGATLTPSCSSSPPASTLAAAMAREDAAIYVRRKR